MEPKNVLLNKNFRKRIVSEGLFALYVGEFEEWAEHYGYRDEAYAPGEIEYVRNIRSYFIQWQANKGKAFNPRVKENEGRLEQIFSEVERLTFLRKKSFP